MRYIAGVCALVVSHVSVVMIFQEMGRNVEYQHTVLSSQAPIFRIRYSFVFLRVRCAICEGVVTHFLHHRHDHGVQLSEQGVGGAFSAVHYP